MVGKRRSKEEAARLHAGDGVELKPLKTLCQLLDGKAQPLAGIKDAGDIAEKNARAGEVGNADDIFFEGFHNVEMWKCENTEVWKCGNAKV